MTTIAEKFGRDDWTRFTLRQRLTRYGVLLGCA